ncbi:hypothetical protein BGX28_010385 [Mortierella sp. GBA30]|nr:hypothetical protein BGX28_010385 [Mortierella sp. GBA30]
MHIQSSTLAAVLILSIALLGYLAPVAEAHSWLDCTKWVFKKPDSNDYSDNGGRCEGYARRYPLGHSFGTLDSASPSRHYQQPGDPDKAPPCSDAKHGKDKDVGSDETLADPPEDAYGGKWGAMTQTQVGETLCMRWPAKNHAESNEHDTQVQINLSDQIGKDPTQQEFLHHNVANLPYKNCGRTFPADKRPCGGCFTVPDRNPGIYTLQWRWELNDGEWYTSCADINITVDAKSSSKLTKRRVL